jgi:hypothetical protein
MVEEEVEVPPRGGCHDEREKHAPTTCQLTIPVRVSHFVAVQQRVQLPA